MTSQGTASGRFQRAIERRNLQAAEMAAREMGQLSLMHALSLVACYARVGDVRFERAALRWLERLIAERDIGLSDVQLAAVALASLRTKHHQRAEKVLLGLL
jgi:hypothetical protein